MKRRVLVYRAENGAQNVFGHEPETEAPVTRPEDRVAIDSFTINEPHVDAARKIASDFVFKRHRERPESMGVLEDGGITVTLRARRS